MTDFTLHRHTAKFDCRMYDKSRLYEIVVTGVLTRKNIGELSDEAIARLQDATALVVRLDAALITIHLADWPQGKRHPWWNPPVAVIVSPNMHSSAITLSERLAQDGLIQAVFLPSQAKLAYRWAARHAALAHRAVPA